MLSAGPRGASVSAVSAEPLDILVVDDESELREQIRRLFERDGHRVMAVPDGRAAIPPETTGRFDVVLLDVALGTGPNGYDVCRTLRERRNVVPIIMLTALDSEADDVLSLGPLVLDRSARSVTADGRPVELTFSEFEVLQAMMSRPGVLFNRQELLRAIWGDSAYRDPRGIDVHIRHLREKLERVPERPEMLLTVRGVGYRLHAP